jgi:hypothetical protein
MDGCRAGGHGLERVKGGLRYRRVDGNFKGMLGFLTKPTKEETRIERGMRSIHLLRTAPINP